MALLLFLTSALGLPQDLAGAPEQILRSVSAAFRFPIEVNIATTASIYGSFRFTIDYRDGFIRRQVMWQSRVPTLIPRMLTTFIAGVLIGLWCSLVFYLWLSAAAQHIVADFEAMWTSALLGGCCSLWGLFVGSLVRAHLLSLFLVPTTLALTIPLTLWTPELAQWSPFGAFVKAFGTGLPNGSTLTHPTLVSAIWLIAGMAVSLDLFKRRDLR